MVSGLWGQRDGRNILPSLSEDRGPSGARTAESHDGFVAPPREEKEEGLDRIDPNKKGY